MRRKVFLIAAGVILLAVFATSAAQIVVLTEEPVAEFTLPDGKVLRNAYVWKRNSQGLMIIHDGGQFFLNFKTLPDAWRKAYAVDASIVPAQERVAKRPDQYELFPLLERIKGVSHGSVIFFESKTYSGDADDVLISACALQALLDRDFETALRLNGVVEEHYPDSPLEDLSSFFIPCDACSGQGVFLRPCRECEGTGKCPKCNGAGEIESQFINADPLRCVYCRGEGVCPQCKGEGKRSFRCSTCNGRRRLLQQEVLRERIAIYAEQLNQIRAGEQ